MAVDAMNPKGGRPTKPDLDEEELAAVMALLEQGDGQKPGFGTRSAAKLVSKMRGAEAVSISPEEHKRRRVSARWLERQLLACGKTWPAAKPRRLRRTTPLPPNAEHGAIQGPERHSEEQNARRDFSLNGDFVPGGGGP